MKKREHNFGRSAVLCDSQMHNDRIFDHKNKLLLWSFRVVILETTLLYSIHTRKIYLVEPCLTVFITE